MARTFVVASSQYLTNANAVVSGTPLTMACWFKPTDTAGGASKSLMTIDDGAGAANYFLLRSFATTGACSALANGNSSSVGTGTDGVWSHHAAVFASSTSRTAYKDGVAGTAETTSATPASLTTTNIGRLWAATQFAAGDIADAAIWNVALDADELTALWRGISPLLIRPASLIAYWPLVGNDSPEPDRWRNRYDLTLSGAPAKADHPRIYMPASPWVHPVAAASQHRMFMVFQ